MKKLVLMMLIATGFSVTTYAQDSSYHNKTNGKRHHFSDTTHRSGGQMQDLNLTDAQKQKFAEMKQVSKAKRDSIMNDNALTKEQKQAKLQQLRKENMQQMNSELTDEQKSKLKDMHEKRMKYHYNKPLSDSTHQSK